MTSTSSKNRSTAGLALASASSAPEKSPAAQ
jgi:hypothetical protein